MSTATNTTPRVKIALVDDHVLLRNALATIINGFDGCKVIYQAGNGKELMNQLSGSYLPDLILLDLNMAEMDGLETARWLHKTHPAIHVLMLTMYDTEPILIRLLQAGVKGFLKKDIHHSELRVAIESVIDNGFYYSRNSTSKLVNLLKAGSELAPANAASFLNDQELQFLKLVCSDKTYKEIAMELKLNPRSVDNLRDKLFEKLDVKSRVGLAMYAIRNGIARY